MQVCDPRDFGFRSLCLPGGWRKVWRKGHVEMDSGVCRTLHKQCVLFVFKIIFPPLVSFIKLKISLERWRQIYPPTATKNDGALVM